jgi:hypothetical protein
MAAGDILLRPLILAPISRVMLRLTRQVTGSPMRPSLMALLIKAYLGSKRRV